MSRPSQPPRPKRVWDDPRIVVPADSVWMAMSPAERDAAFERIRAVFEEYREAMSEGVRHFRRKSGAAADLEAYFRRAGRRVFIACELAVLYPREPAFVPDILVVLDCDPDIEPERWHVAEQGRGLDCIIEVRNQGRKHKDLVQNVSDYARLRIPEYFSYDCRRGVLRGWRLPSPSATAYQPIVPQLGYLHSKVLGLELAIVHQRLRFFVNGALVPDAEELAARLQSIADDRLAALDESERQRADALDQLARTQVTLARTVLALLEARGVSLSPEQHARVAAEHEADALERWAERAPTAATAAELFADDAPPAT